MIPFLLVTSIVNIALGYALAVYLGRASATSRESTALEPMADDGAPQFEMWTEELLAPSAGHPIAEIAESQEIGTSDDVIVTTPNEPAHSDAEEIEHELLAGIEDFRKQLAQLRGQEDRGGALNPVAIGAQR